MTLPRRIRITTSIATALLLALHGSFATADITDDLLEKLRAKGVLDEEEYETFRRAREAEKQELREARRKQAMKSALEEQRREVSREQYAGRFNNQITFETADRRNTFNLGGRLHVDYRNFPGNTSADTFDLRRTYLTFQGKANEWITWDITGEFGRLINGVPLDVAWVNFAYSDVWQLRVGQFKMPFSMEELQSSRFMDFQERSLANVLTAQRERGFMIHGVPRLGVTYGIALSNGSARNQSEVVAPEAGPDVIGRIAVNFAELFDKPNAVYHVALSGAHGESPTGYGLAAQTEARGLVFFNSRGFDGRDIHRNRANLEAAFAYGPFKLQGEYVTTEYYGRSAANVEYSRQQSAYYLFAVWMLTGERYAETFRNGLFGRMVPNSTYIPGGDSWGAWELGLRYSQFDASDFIAGNAPGTGQLATNFTPGGSQVVGFSPGANVAYASIPTNGANAWTLGLKWIMTPNLRWYLNYVNTNFDTPVTVNPNYGGVASFTTDGEKSINMRMAYDF